MSDETPTQRRLSVNINEEVAEILSTMRGRGISATEATRRAFSLLAVHEREITQGKGSIYVKTRTGDIKELVFPF